MEPNRTKRVQKVPNASKSTGAKLGQTGPNRARCSPYLGQTGQNIPYPLSLSCFIGGSKAVIGSSENQIEPVGL